MTTPEFSAQDKLNATLMLALQQRIAARQHTDSPSGHLNAEAMAAVITRTGDELQRQQWKTHISHCASCYEIFIELADWQWQIQRKAQAPSTTRSVVAEFFLGIQTWKLLLVSAMPVLLLCTLVYLLPRYDAPELAHSVVAEQKEVEVDSNVITASAPPSDAYETGPGVSAVSPIPAVSPSPLDAASEVAKNSAKEPPLELKDEAQASTQSPAPLRAPPRVSTVAPLAEPEQSPSVVAPPSDGPVVAEGRAKTDALATSGAATRLAAPAPAPVSTSAPEIHKAEQAPSVVAPPSYGSALAENRTKTDKPATSGAATGLAAPAPDPVSTFAPKIQKAEQNSGLIIAADQAPQPLHQENLSPEKNISVTENDTKHHECRSEVCEHNRRIQLIIGTWLDDSINLCASGKIDLIERKKSWDELQRLLDSENLAITQAETQWTNTTAFCSWVKTLQNVDAAK